MIDGSGDLNNTDKVIVWDNKGQPQINNLSLISNDANSQSSQTRSIGSQLTAGNNISVHSFNDLTSEATQFKAGHDIALSAQEDMTLKAAHNEDHHVEQNTQKGSFDKQKTDIVEDHIITAEGNQLNAGANIRINVDALGHQQDSGDVSFEGSQLNAGKDVLLAADGDINVYAAQTYELHREEHHKKSTLGLKKDNVGERNERQGLDGSTLKATDDLSVLSGNDITIVASDVNSGGDTHLEAFNNVLISAGEEVEKTESWTEKSNTFSDGKLYSLDEEREGEASIKAQSSQVQAGGNITLTAGRAKVVGSNLTAGGSIEAKTDIGDIEILAAKETTESFSHEKHVSASIADAMGNPDDIIQDDEEGKLKLKLADAVYDDEKTRTSKIEHTSSELVANEDITLEAIGDLLIEGSNIIADADRNQIGDVNLTAEENIIIQEAENLLTKIKEEKHGEAVLSFVVQHQAIEVIRALKNVKDAKKQVKQAQEDYRAYKKDIKRLEVELAEIEQDYKDKTSGITYDDVVEMREIVEATKDDEDWYKAGVVAATVNMAAKVTAVIQQTVALATSTGTYGFNAGVQLDVKGSKSRTEEHQSTSLASNIVGQNITIQTGGDEAQGSQTTIQGSHLQANNAINIDTGQLNIQASKDRYQMTKDTESIEISVQQTVYGAAGGPSVSGSLERSRDKAAESTYNNSTLNANNISLNSTDDTNIRGANVHANEQLMVDVGGDLNVESKQNRSRSSSVGASISGGFSFGGAEGDQASGTKSAAENGKSFSGAAKNLANLGGSNGKVSSVNVGASSSNSRSRSKETVLTSLTSGGSADITVKKNTHITGALIATQDENGKDLGNLNLTTKTLTYADLNNVNESSSRSTGISTSVGINSSANPADPAQQDAPDAQGEDNLRVNTTNIQHSNSSHYDKSKTLATLGQGNINIADKENSGDLDRLNRDVDNVDKDIVSVDRSKGNIDLTVDHRMLSEEGRAEIVNDFKETIKGAGRVGDSIQEVWGSITNGEVSAEEAATLEQWANDKRGQIALALETGSSVTENKQIHYYIDNNGGMVAVDWNQFLASEGARDILRNALALQIEEEGSLRGSPNYQQIREDFNYYSDRVLDSDAIIDAVSYFSGANLITRIGAESLKGAGKVLDNIFSRSPSPTINPRIYDGELGAVVDAKSITQVTDEMKANPYHKDWQNYVGKEHRAVGADVVDSTIYIDSKGSAIASKSELPKNYKQDGPGRLLEDAAFAQVPAKSTKAFSEEGQAIYSKLAGRNIVTVNDLTDVLKQGVIKPNQIPLDYVLIDGQKVIANTRTSTALINANIPKSQWSGVNKTGVKAYGDVTFDDLVNNQLRKNYGGSIDKARR